MALSSKMGSWCMTGRCRIPNPLLRCSGRKSNAHLLFLCASKMTTVKCTISSSCCPIWSSGCNPSALCRRSIQVSGIPINSKCSFLRQRFRCAHCDNLFLSSISFSNIAVKVNAKLFDKWTKARAWNIKVESTPNGGIPWLNEVPTLVLGFCLTTGALSHEVVLVMNVCPYNIFLANSWGEGF